MSYNKRLLVKEKLKRKKELWSEVCKKTYCGENAEYFMIYVVALLL